MAYSGIGQFGLAIKDFTNAVYVDPDDAKVYNTRGFAQLHLEGWEEAKSDLNTATAMRVDIVTEFHSLYESVSDFEQKNGVKLPDDIAAMLTPK